MPKESFEEAEKTAKNRMVWGQADHESNQACHPKLDVICKSFESEISTQSTFAVGRIGQVLYYARQGGVKQELIDQIDLGSVGCTSKVDCTVTGKIIEKGSLGGITLAGIHAEMMIVRCLVLAGGHAKSNLAGLGLEIATTKGCCLDCAGFLNQYKIPHTVTNGNPSLMWRHPVTLSLYRHQNTNPDSGLKFYDPTLERKGSANNVNIVVSVERTLYP